MSPRARGTGRSTAHQPSTPGPADARPRSALPVRPVAATAFRAGTDFRADAESVPPDRTGTPAGPRTAPVPSDPASAPPGRPRRAPNRHAPAARTAPLAGTRAVPAGRAARAVRSAGGPRPGPPWAPPPGPGEPTGPTPHRRHRLHRRAGSHRTPRTPSPRAAFPLAAVALFSAGYLPAYLLPAIVARVVGDLGVTSTQAGAVGSGLLLASAAAGLLLAARVHATGARRLARAGLVLLVLGFALAAAATALLPLVLGCLLGGLGTGTVAAVAGVEAAAAAQPHRVSAFGLLAASAGAGSLFLALPHLGGGHTLPFAALAAYGAATWPSLRRLPNPAPAPTSAVPHQRGRAAVLPVAPRHPDTVARSSPVPAARPWLPHRLGGSVLAGGIALWSMAQNALWGVSGQIGLHRVGLTEAALGLVFAGALGGGLLGVAAAAAFGSRLGRALPVGLGTATIAACVAMAGSAHTAGPFAVGEVLWNTAYPIVLTSLLGLAAELDQRGRWAVLVGAASALGVACGPLAGTTLVTTVGFPGTGLALGALLAAVAVPLTAVATRAAVATLTAVATSATEPAVPGRAMTLRQARPPQPPSAGCQAAISEASSPRTSTPRGRSLT
ncbi:MFS transporter [Kitasatospora sp. NPDC002227]|uniref:MFS transporter n=1 Tax=Kitasatospora sp. NPDC002227 TaxID=3154773 RepID=UPI003332E4F4